MRLGDPDGVVDGIPEVGLTVGELVGSQKTCVCND